jgi:hypothetical protein
MVVPDRSGELRHNVGPGLIVEDEFFAVRVEKSTPADGDLRTARSGEDRAMNRPVVVRIRSGAIPEARRLHR